MKVGATDYLVKGEITGPFLSRAIRYAVERKKVERHLKYLAERDALTGLSNRMVFQIRLDDAIVNAKRTGSMLAILLLDLDHFKDVNDTLGHPVGDSLIKETAKRLESCTRATDTVARLGGDEFGIIATNIAHPDDIIILAQKITERLAEPVLVDGHQVFTSSSIGITIYPFDNGDPDQILKHADLALYQAKCTNRGTFEFYDAELNEKMHERKSLELELREGLKRQEFVLHFQPKVSVVSGDIVGAEALIRWNHPQHGMVGPDLFIPVAEATGIIVPQGEWVLREACRQCVAWRREGLPPIPVAVNVSTVQFRRSELVELVSRIIEETGIDPSCLELEITETMIMDKIEATTQILNRLHDLGVRLAIDDFGTGHSSLAYLIPTALEFDSRKGLHARFCVIQGCWQQGSVFNANDSFAKRL